MAAGKCWHRLLQSEIDIMTAMVRRLAWIVLASMALSPAQADTAAEQLHRQLSGLHSLQAEFKQQVKDSDGEVVQESSGTLALQRPNRLRWESQQPYHYLLVSDGDTLWRYDADLEQLNEEPFDPQLAQAPAMILSASREQLDAQFKVRLQTEGSTQRYVLQPVDEQMYRQLALRFDDGKLVGMELIDNLEQHTHIRFVAPHYNPSLGDALFHFDKSQWPGTS